jgi:large repetitive protein
MNPSDPTVQTRHILHKTARGRGRRRWVFERLEDRQLLSSGVDLAGATLLPAASGTSSGVIAPATSVLFRIDPTSDALLIASVHAVGARTRLSLLDAQGDLVLESDGQSAADADDAIRVHVLAGTDYLEVQSLGGAASFALTTELDASSTPVESPLTGAPIFGRRPLLVAGDFNGDGRDDLAAAEGVREGVGDGSFLAPTSALPISSVIASKVALVAGDFNGDGRLDLAVAGETAATHGVVEMLAGNGDGTFRAGAPIDLGDFTPTAIVAGDFDGNGRAELAVAGVDSTAEGRLSLLASDGGGNFVTIASTGLGSLTPNVLVSGRFRDAGRLDLAVAGSGADGQGALEIVLNAGEGIVQAKSQVALGGFTPTLAAAADLNGDGVADLVLAGSGGRVEWLPIDGDGSAGIPVTIRVDGLSPTAISSGDFTGDGRIGLAIAGIGGPAQAVVTQVLMFVGSALGAPQLASTTTVNGFDPSANPSLLLTGNFGGDGRVSLAVAGQSSVEVVLNEGGGRFAPVGPIDLGASNPVAMAAGDFNEDGHIDLAVAGTAPSAASRIAIFEGHGDGTFVSARPINLGAFTPTALASGDFTGAGHADLAVAGFDPTTGHALVEILAGAGDGTFQAATTIDLGVTNPVSMTTGDFGGDGGADLAIAEISPGTGESLVEVLVNQGDGAFLPGLPTALSAITPIAIAAGAFAADGRDDLAVAGIAPGTGRAVVEILRGDEDDTFVAGPPAGLGDLIPTGIAAGEFNGGGLAELVLIGHDPAGDQEYVIVGRNGAGLSPQPPTRLYVDGTSAIATGDFDGNGRADLAIAETFAYAEGDDQVVVFSGAGDGTFYPDLPFAIGALDPSLFVTGDYNGDGRADLASVGNDPSGQAAFVELTLGNGDGTFARPVQLMLRGFVPTAVIAGRFAGGGSDDLAIAGVDALGQEALELVAAGANGTASAVTMIDLGVEATPQAIATGDFNGDGHADVAIEAVSSSGEVVVQVLMGNGDGTFASPVRIDPGGLRADALAAADFDGNGQDDLAVAGTQPDGHGTVEVFLSRGEAGFAGGRSIDLGSVTPAAMVAGDFHADGHVDVAVTGRTPDGSGVLVAVQGDGRGNFRAGVPSPVGTLSLSSGLAVAKFSGVPNSEIPVVDQVLLALSGGAFGVALLLPSDENPLSPVAVADFNGDGRADLVAFDGSVPEVLPGNGDGTFGPRPAIDLGGANPSAAAAGDFNADGHTDVALAEADGISVLFGEGEGNFRVGPTTGLGKFAPAAIVEGDFNGDGRADLAVAGTDTSSGQMDVEILLGDGDGTFQAQPLIDLGPGSATTAGGVDLVAGRFDGDGTIDLVVLATPSGGLSFLEELKGNGRGAFAAQRPFFPSGMTASAMAVGKFTDDGHDDLAILGADSSDRSEIVVLSGGPGGEFAIASTIALAGLAPAGGLVAGDFSGDGRDDLALAGSDPGIGQEVVEVLLNRGGGRFVDSATIGLADTSAAAVVAGDFTGDGRGDLAVVGSPALFASESVQVLAGKGDGTFRPLPSLSLGTSSTLVVAGAFSGDGRSDLFLAGTSGVTVALSEGNGEFAGPSEETEAGPIQETPVVAFPGDGSEDVFIVDQSGDILWRKGQSQPGSFGPPIIINSGVPARDIAFVPTSEGGLIAAVDLEDSNVSLYALSGGVMKRAGSLAAGLEPAQVIAGDINGDGRVDLVVRDVGDGTASVYLGDGKGDFTRGPDVAIGLGSSDIALLPVSAAGRLALVVTNRVAGTVGVFAGVGDGTLGAARWYPAGLGPYAQGLGPMGLVSLGSAEATAGVAGGVFTSGGAMGLATIDPATGSLAVLAGLGGGALADPVRLLTSTPGSVIRSSDFNGDGVDDLAVLGADGVSVYLGDGRGGFHLSEVLPVGAGAMGLTVADVTGDGIGDLVVGNQAGDVLVLVGDGHGHFAQYREVDRQVALAVADTGANGEPTFALSDRATSVVSAQATVGATVQVVGDQSQGVLTPGMVALSDLNGDGISDIVVANGGGNNVLVYLGEGGGKYAPPQAFAAGTDPVDVTVADVNGDGTSDLVVTNHGSDDISILLGRGDGTFATGPRLRAGSGPTSAIVQAVSGTGNPDILVTDGQSNDVRLLQGLGGGFFNDVNPTIFHTGIDPVQVIVGNFTGGANQQDLVAIDEGSNALTFFRNIGGDLSLPGQDIFGEEIASGGETPVAAVAGQFGGETTGLLVANNDGQLAVFVGGAGGLQLDRTFEQENLPNPTSLAIDAAGDVFGATEGLDAAIPVILGLGVSSSPPPAAPGEQQASPLQPESLSPLGLVATLLSVSVESVPEETAIAAGDGAGSPGGLANQPTANEEGANPGSGGDGAEVPAAVEPPAVQAAIVVARFIMGLDEALEGARLKARGSPIFALWGPLAGRTGAAIEAVDAVLSRWGPAIASLGVPVPAVAVDLLRSGIAAARGIDAADGPVAPGAAARESVSGGSRADAPLPVRIPWRPVLALGAAALAATALVRAHWQTARPAAWAGRRDPRPRRGRRTDRSRGSTGWNDCSSSGQHRTGRDGRPDESARRVEGDLGGSKCSASTMWNGRRA